MQPQFVCVARRERKDTRDLKYQAVFGRRIKDLRAELHWAQGDLAAASGVSEGQISAIENGHESPRLHTMKSLALAFGMTPSKLLDFPFEYKVNTNFRRGKIRNSGTTSSVRRLFDEGFFKAPRSVREVIEQCKKKYALNLKSAETSGALLQLVKANYLRKVSSTAVRNLYQARLSK